MGLIFCTRIQKWRWRFIEMELKSIRKKKRTKRFMMFSSPTQAVWRNIQRRKWRRTNFNHLMFKASTTQNWSLKGLSIFTNSETEQTLHLKGVKRRHSNKKKTKQLICNSRCRISFRNLRISKKANSVL